MGSIHFCRGAASFNTELRAVTLEAYANAIVETAQNFSDKGDIVLVGHSMGGAAVTAAASLMPHLFRKIIYVCAFLPSNGQSVAQLGAESKQLGTVGPIASLYEKEGVLVLDPSKIAGTFFNDYPSNNVDDLVQSFKPQALKPIATPVTVNAQFNDLDKAYIVCKQDLAISPKLQELMAQRSNVQQISYLDAGHEPFFTCTDDLIHELLTLI